MKVYALVGKSGTGKSYQAVNLCKELNIEAIIDDGLFIEGNDVVAGISAKRQATMIGAIKTALFTTDEHKETVTAKIKELNPKSILVLGTSDEMVNRIVARLELPEIQKRIRIEQITTEKEREEARHQRRDFGKHVIPVPTFQLKRDFAGYFVDPLKIFRTWGQNKGSIFSEKSVVRPTYSYLGDYIISDKVIEDIIFNVVQRAGCVRSVVRADILQHEENLKIKILVFMRKNCNIIKEAQRLQKAINEKIDYMTAFNVERVDVEIRGLR